MPMVPFRHHPNRWLSAAMSFALLALAACSHTKPAPAEAPASALQAFRHGVDAYREEDYARAARQFELAALKDDRDATIQYNLGLAYYMLEAYPESIEAYQKCLKLDPKFADAHMNLALAYDRTYDLDQANAHYNAYLALVRAQPVNGTATAAGDGAPSQRSREPQTAQQGAGQASGESSHGVPGVRKSNGRPALVLGGEPLSSLPGGNLARYKGDPHSASGSRAGPPAAGPSSADGRESAGAALRGPSERWREAQTTPSGPGQAPPAEPAEPAERLREAPTQSRREAHIEHRREAQTTPARSGGATFSSAEPWWTQETLPQTP